MGYQRAAQQPDTTELFMADGIFAKSMVIQRANTVVPQHSHTYAHVSVLARGAVRLWKDEALVGDFHAPAGILIEARAKHTFMSLVDDTAILCVHDIGAAEAVSIEEEHQLVGSD